MGICGSAEACRGEEEKEGGTEESSQVKESRKGETEEENQEDKAGGCRKEKSQEFKVSRQESSGE